jgi:hypothetical protein
LLDATVKKHSGWRAPVVGLLGAIVISAGLLPEARAQEAEARGPARRLRRAAAPDPFARRLSLALAQGLHAGAGPRLVGAPYLRYGLEPEPPAQAELKRQLFFFLSEVTGESSLRRAAASLPFSSTLRAFVDGEAQDSMRQRATFVEIEGLKGPSPRPISPLARAAFASSGVALLASGIVCTRLVSAGNTVAIAPQPWPMGIRISGTFGLP